MRAAIQQTERSGPLPGLEEIRPGVIEIDSQSSHSSEGVLQWYGRFCRLRKSCRPVVAALWTCFTFRYGEASHPGPCQRIVT
eukprot:2945393-Amphidinium_carterae.1